MEIKTKNSLRVYLYRVAPMIIFVISITTAARADECDSVYGQGKSLFESGNSAFDRKDYESAERLYTQATSSFDRVAAMKGCRCPKVAGAARSWSVSSRQNAQVSKSNLERTKERERQKAEYEAKEQARQVQQQQRSQAQEQQRNLTQETLFGSPLGSAALQSSQSSLSDYLKSLSQAGSFSYPASVPEEEAQQE